MPDPKSPSTQNVIVSAFMSGVNQREDRSADKYIEYGKKLVNINLPKVVFIERETYSKYWCNGRNVSPSSQIQLDISGVLSPEKGGGGGGGDYECVKYEYILDTSTQTMFVFFKKEWMYLYSHLGEITQFALETSNPNKDTVEYMFIQCYKTEWMRLAITLVETLAAGGAAADMGTWTATAYPPNNQYIWMDFGIYHMFGDNETAFVSQMAAMDDRVKARFVAACANGHTFQTVYFASCWDHTLYYPLDVYTRIHWVFAGSVFGGYRDALLAFADKVKDECLRTIRDKKHLMWEVNIWYLIYLRYPHYFDFYRCDHNATIIAHY